MEVPLDVLESFVVDHARQRHSLFLHKLEFADALKLRSPLGRPLNPDQVRPKLVVDFRHDDGGGHLGLSDPYSSGLER